MSQNDQQTPLGKAWTKLNVDVSETTATAAQNRDDILNGHAPTAVGRNYDAKSNVQRDLYLLPGAAGQTLVETSGQIWPLRPVLKGLLDLQSKVTTSLAVYFSNCANKSSAEADKFKEKPVATAFSAQGSKPPAARP